MLEQENKVGVITINEGLGILVRDVLTPAGMLCVLMNLGTIIREPHRFPEFIQENNISVIVCEYPTIDLAGQEAINGMVNNEEVQGRAFVMVSAEERVRKVYQLQAGIQEVVIPFDIDSFANLVHRSRLAVRFGGFADSPKDLYA